MAIRLTCDTIGDNAENSSIVINQYPLYFFELEVYYFKIN